MDFLSFEGAQAFLTVVMIDLVLAGDNAVVIGLAAAGLPAHQRGKAILIGVLAATVLRILFALIATQLLAIIGLLFAGGVLLLWVCWKMWRELHMPQHTDEESIQGKDLDGDGKIGGRPIVQKTLGQAVVQIVIADVSMSLDNVLAVAGAAHEHPWILVFGLALSVLLMGIAATFIARLLHRHRWIAYIGLLIILWVSLHMMWDGGLQIYDCNPAWFGDGTELGPHCPSSPAPSIPAAVAP
ncbi:MAG TPA: TerC family protein [Hyphomonadaceae bacterium]|nr:TerC family protein [Hyphomonadaceae bacterium]